MIVRLACILLLTGLVCTPASAQNGQSQATSFTRRLASIARPRTVRGRSNVPTSNSLAQTLTGPCDRRPGPYRGRKPANGRRLSDGARMALGTPGAVSRRSILPRCLVAVDRARGRRLWTASVATDLKPHSRHWRRLPSAHFPLADQLSLPYLIVRVVKSALRKRRSRHRPISREDASWCVTRIARPYTRNPWVAGARYPELYMMRQLLTEDHPLLLAA